MLAIAGFSLPVSLLLGDDWTQFGRLSVGDWTIYALFSLGVLFGANMGQIGALRHLGAPMVSSLMAWRLVSALAFALLLLDERLTSAWQVLGALTVLVTIIWYLGKQRKTTPGI